MYRAGPTWPGDRRDPLLGEADTVPQDAETIEWRIQKIRWRISRWAVTCRFFWLRNRSGIHRKYRYEYQLSRHSIPGIESNKIFPMEGRCCDPMLPWHNLVTCYNAKRTCERTVVLPFKDYERNSNSLEEVDTSTLENRFMQVVWSYSAYPSIAKMHAWCLHK